MATATHTGPGLTGVDPALESEAARAGYQPTGGATMSVGGTTMKTVVQLAFAIAGGVWGRSSGPPWDSPRRAVREWQPERGRNFT